MTFLYHACQTLLRRGKDERGFALLAVIWGLAILSLIAATVSASSLNDRRETHYFLLRARQKALAEAGLADAIYSLEDIATRHNQRLDGRPYELSFGGSDLAISIQDESGLIDLNYSTPETLVRLFVSTGVPDGTAHLITEGILYQRRHGIISPELRRPLGTAQEFSGFESIDELKLVPGVTPRIFDNVASSITVYSHQSAVNIYTAPAQVLSTVTLPRDLSVADFVNARNNQGPTESASHSDLLALSNGNGSFAGRAFAITVAILNPDQKCRYTGVIRITDDARRPYWIEDWRMDSR